MVHQSNEENPEIISSEDEKKLRLEDQLRQMGRIPLARRKRTTSKSKSNDQKNSEHGSSLPLSSPSSNNQSVASTIPENTESTMEKDPEENPQNPISEEKDDDAPKEKESDERKREDVQNLDLNTTEEQLQLENQGVDNVNAGQDRESSIQSVSPTVPVLGPILPSLTDKEKTGDS